MSATRERHTETLELQFQLTLEDYEETVLHTVGRTGIFTKRPTTKRFLVLWLLLVVLFVTVNLVFPVREMSTFAVGLTLIAIIAVLAFWLMPFSTARSGFRKQGFAGKTYEYRFDGEGVRTLEPGMKTWVEWSRIQKTVIKSGVLMLWLSPMQVLIVPLRACSDAQQRKVLLVLVEAYVKNTKYSADTPNARRNA